VGLIVPGEGPPRARMMLVGQNPGSEEAKQGRPFVGPAGKYFDRVLAQNGIPRDEVYITNAVKETTLRNRKPTVGEMCRWAPELEEEMDRVQPRVVVLMGVVAQSVARRAGVRYIETPHPAAALRFPWLRRDFEAALAVLGREFKKQKRRKQDVSGL